MANVIEKVRAIAADAGRTGMAVGAPVVTLDGVMPVEFVEPGDRIVTRTGIRKLTAKRASRYTGTAYVVKGGSLGHVLKGEDSVLLPATRVLVRDWRAMALFGVEASRDTAARVTRVAFSRIARQGFQQDWSNVSLSRSRS
mgnify:CR=1 FL=1